MLFRIIPYLAANDNESHSATLQEVYQLLDKCRAVNYDSRPDFKVIERELKRLGKMLLSSSDIVASDSRSSFFSSNDGDDMVYNMIRASHGISSSSPNNGNDADETDINDEYDSMFSELIYSVESKFAPGAPRQYAAFLFESDELLQLKGLEFLQRALERKTSAVSEMITQELALIPQIVALLRDDFHLINHAAMSLLAELAAVSAVNIRLILQTNVLQKIEAAFVTANDNQEDVKDEVHDDFLYLGEIAKLLFFLCMAEISPAEKEKEEFSQQATRALVFCLCEKYPITIRDEMGREDLIQLLKHRKREAVVGNHVMESLLHLMHYVNRTMGKEALSTVFQLLRSYTKETVQVVDPFLSTLTSMLSFVASKVSNGDGQQCKFAIMFCSLCIKFLVGIPEFVLDSVVPLQQGLLSLLALQCESQCLDDGTVAFVLQAWQETEQAMTESNCCPQRHRLQCTDSEEAMLLGMRVTCDQCKEKIDLKKAGCFYSCRICDYDVCSVCCLTSQSSAAAVISSASLLPPPPITATTTVAVAAPLPLDRVCPEMHTLEQLTGRLPTGYAAVVCDMCSAVELERSPLGYLHCQQCQYDLCAACVLLR